MGILTNLWINRGLLLTNLLKQANQLGVTLSLLQAQKLLQYLDLLRQWNKVHNLCADASYQHMISYHLLDSISIASSTVNCEQKNILDVGTGAGLPGIPLAIAVPTCLVTLLDSKAKKIAFVNHAINILQLPNANTELIRVEKYKPLSKFDLVISRAFANLSKFVKLAGHLVKDNGQLIAMKSDPNEFVYGSNVSDNYKIIDLKKLQVPGITNKRCLVILEAIRANNNTAL